MMPNQNPSRRPVLIAAIVLVVVIILGAVYLLLSHKPSAVSGPGKTEATADTLYYGFDQLSSFGISNYQITNLKSAIKQYIKQSNQSITAVTITSGSVTVAPHDRYSSSTRSTVQFSLTFGQASYTARMDYFNITGIHLYLYDSNTKLVYDSGDINSSQ